MQLQRDAFLLAGEALGVGWDVGARHTTLQLMTVEHPGVAGVSQRDLDRVGAELRCEEWWKEGRKRSQTRWEKNTDKLRYSAYLRKEVKKPKGETEHALKLRGKSAKGFEGNSIQSGEHLCSLWVWSLRRLYRSHVCAFPEGLDDAPFDVQRALDSRFQICYVTLGTGRVFIYGGILKTLVCVRFCVRAFHSIHEFIQFLQQPLEVSIPVPISPVRKWTPP